MSRKLPAELMRRRNDHPLVIDRDNLSHRQGTGPEHVSACGRQGTVVTLAQAIVWSGRWCAHAACYEPPYPTRGAR